ncbi:hypothetical protein PSENEW3_00006107 [Picochlorum sp. SENEW3]|nr:hypothetical protein PSENEW3_00006107 [Picochlorum sp. SENEW3]
MIENVARYSASRMWLTLCLHVVLFVLLGAANAISNPEDFVDASGPCTCRGDCEPQRNTPSVCEYGGSSKSCRVSRDCDKGRETAFGKYLCCTGDLEPQEEEESQEEEDKSTDNDKSSDSASSADFVDSSGPCTCRGDCEPQRNTPSVCEYGGSSKSCRVSTDCNKGRETAFGKYLCCTGDLEPQEEEESQEEEDKSTEDAGADDADDADDYDYDYGMLPSYTDVEDCKSNCAIAKETVNFPNYGQVTLDLCYSYCGCYQENGQYIMVEQFYQGESIGMYYTCNECSEKWVRDCESKRKQYETINQNVGNLYVAEAQNAIDKAQQSLVAAFNSEYSDAYSKMYDALERLEPFTLGPIQWQDVKSNCFIYTKSFCLQLLICSYAFQRRRDLQSTQAQEEGTLFHWRNQTKLPYLLVAIFRADTCSLIYPGDDDYGPSYTEVEDYKINCAIKKQTINFSNIGEVTLDVCSSYCGCYQENGQYVKVEQFREGESIGEYYTCNECSEKWVEECERDREMYETINDNNGKV